MRRLMKKKVKIFEKEISVFLIVLVGMIGLASAALIPYFASITGLVSVDQGLTVDGENWDYWESSISYGDGQDFTSLEEGVLSSEDYSLINSADVDANIKIATTCKAYIEGNDGCDDAITTDMVLLSVTGFTDAANAFDWAYYKKSYYETPVSNLADLDNVTYAFKVTGRTGFADTTAPYIVLVSNNFPAGAAVQIIPDEESYSLNTEYNKTIDGTTRFHVPGDTSGHNCDNQDYSTGCTLVQIQDYYASVVLSKMSVALGAWSGATNSISASAGISMINGEQAVHKSFIVAGGGETSSLKVVTDFPKMMKPDTYTFTTQVLPA